MTQSRVVFLAYYFPPLVGIASERAAALAEGLIELGWESIVITTDAGDYYAVDQPNPGSVSVVRTRTLALSRSMRRFYDLVIGPGSHKAQVTAAAALSGPHEDRLRRLVREFAYLPDAQMGWIPFAVRAARRMVARPPGAVLLSTSVPYSAHLAAMRVARATGASWVAEFRDPWSTAHEANLPASMLRRRVDRALEKKILFGADHVIVTSQATRNGMLRAHDGLDSERISVITNGFVSTPWRAGPEADQPMELVYAGTVAPGESPELLLRALEHVHCRHPGSFRMRVVGPEQPWLDAAPRRNPPEWLRLDGIVSPADARETMAGGTATVLIQSHPAYASVLPGKVFEYIGVRRPILAIIPLAGELGDVLRAHADVRLIAPSDLSAAEVQIERLLQEHRSGRLRTASVSEEITASLRRTAQARELARILDAVSQPDH